MKANFLALQQLYVPTVSSRESFARELEEMELCFGALKPEVELTVRDSVLGVEGYAVVWNTWAASDGPLERCGKGGTRISPTVSLAEVTMLAKRMTLKNAAAGLPLGGAKSGLTASLSDFNFEAKYRKFVRLLAPILHENGGSFGGFGFDIGARPEHALWACDELQSTRCFTGKPLEMGGTDYDREGIAGYGVVYAAKAAVRQKRMDLAETSSAVQGLGAMGAAVVRYLTEFGGKIKYISDPMIGGTFHFPNGIPSELAAALANRDFVRAIALIEASNREKMPLDEVLYQDVDLLFPCAIQDVITERNVHRVKARILVEAANNPCSAEARQALFERDVLVVPDFIANSGGIIAAFVELTSTVSNAENVITRAKVVQSKNLTKEKIEANVSSMLLMSAELGVSSVQVAQFLALKNIISKRPRIESVQSRTRALELSSVQTRERHMFDPLAGP